MKNLIILGAGRSGTSLLAGIFNKAGYYMGTDYIASRSSNPKGFFEGQEINSINESILKQSKISRRSINSNQRWANMVLRKAPETGQWWLARVPVGTHLCCDELTTMEIAEQTSQVPFCFKDPRFCYTLPIWRPYLKNTVFLCVFRHPAATAASIVKECKEMAYLSSLRMSMKTAERIWQLQYNHILRVHRHEGEWRFIHYDQLFEKSVRDSIGALTGAEIDHTFAETSLRRIQASERVQKQSRDIYSRLCAIAGYT